MEVVKSVSEYILWIKINKSFSSLHNDIIIGALYIPPSQSTFYNDDQFMQLEQDITSMCSENEYVYITGDANSRTAKLKDYTRSDTFLSEYFNFDEETLFFYDCINNIQTEKVNTERSSMDTKTNTHGYNLIEICKNNNIFIVNGRTGNDKNIGKLTFRNQSLIDYTLATLKAMSIIDNFDILDTDKLMSDGHSLISMLIKIPCTEHTNSAKTNAVNKTSQGKWEQDKAIQFMNNINTDEINAIQTNIDTCKLCPNKEYISDISNNIANVFNAASTKTFSTTHRNATGRKTTNIRDKPWFGTKCRNARVIYNAARKQFQQSKLDDDKINLQIKSKLYKSTMNKYIRQHRKQTETKLRNMQQNDPKAYWKILNSLKKKGNTSNVKLDDLYTFFKDVNAKQHENSDDDLNYITDNIDLDDDDNILNTPITQEEIERAILLLNNAKSPGSDMILNEHIKTSKTVMMPIYISLFNLVFSTGILPESWTIGIIKPIYKNKGNAHEPQNYRPITILSCLGKLFTSVLNLRLNNFLDENITLEENQAGFRKGYSTTDHIFVLNSLIELLRKQKKKIYCAFIDFSQAFDSVWRIGLWRKLLHSGINGQFFRVIRNMYSNIKSCVSLNGDNSHFFPSYCGVRQGDSLSPVLFSLFLNDLEAFLSFRENDGITIQLHSEEISFFIKIIVLLYADDTIVISDNETSFQKCLNDFLNYCDLWKLNINYTKTKVIVFGSKKNYKYRFKMGETEIETVDQYKYLGVYFSKSGSFLNAKKHIAEQAKKAMYLLYTRINNIDLPIDLQLKLFDHTVLPILTYGCEIWGFENTNILERIHTDFLRRITKSRKSTPLYMLYGELGRYPLYINIKTRMLQFWNRILSGKQEKIVNMMYSYISSIDTNSKWVTFIENILNETGNSGLIHHDNNINIRGIKCTLIDQFTQSWNAKMRESSKGKNYNIFKDNIKLEDYFKCLPKKLYINLVKFRTCNHKLPIEVGRWYGTELSDRKCNLCNTGDIGDAFHYLLKCPSFNDPRKLYIKPYYYRRANILKFTALLNMKSEPALRKLSLFVAEIMSKFT